MATMVPVTVGSAAGWFINLDLVRAIQPTSTGCIVFFDDAHSLPVSHPANAIAVALRKGLGRRLPDMENAESLNRL